MPENSTSPAAQLSRKSLSAVDSRQARVAEEAAHLPEKILQFGSGRFLRTFVGDFIDSANRRSVFNGRIVIVQSTSHETSRLLDRQDGLYTIWLEGLQRGKPVQEYRVISAISRALAADRQWSQILAVARSENLELIVSNTTEVGIAFDADDHLEMTPPRSFPGKLTAVLYERFKRFSGAPRAGLIVIPCELITDNGIRLKEIVLRLASHWGLRSDFSKWVEKSNRFCSSLVDRIVTGLPSPDRIGGYWQRLGYRDELLCVGEPYALWAIQGDQSVAEQLGFPTIRPEVIVEPDITPYRERKIRILNGAHTASAPLAFLNGCETILELMEDSRLSRFVESLMRQEIAPSLDLDPAGTKDFVDQVLDRFRNPYLRHRLLDITFQSTSKMRLRVVPSLLSYHRKQGRLPPRLVLGFAYYLRFMRAIEERNGRFFGRLEDAAYPIRDDEAAYYYEVWGQGGSDLDDLVSRVCSEERLWGQDLSRVPGLVEMVSASLAHPQERLEAVLDS